MFSTIYNDDLTAKTLPSLIGFGTKRTTIIISKIIISIIMSVVMFLSAFIVFYLMFTILGISINENMSIGLLKILFMNLLKLLAFSTISSVVVYGTQKATFSIVTFILLITSFISQMLSLLLTQIKGIVDLSKFTLIPIVSNLMIETTFLTILPYLIYVMIFITLSVIAFRKKDLEF